MEVQQDFRDLIELFNKHEVDYLIVGAYALGFYGAPRYTGDLDILVKPETVSSVATMHPLSPFVLYRQLDYESRALPTLAFSPDTPLMPLEYLAGVDNSHAGSAIFLAPLFHAIGCYIRNTLGGVLLGIL